MTKKHKNQDNDNIETDSEEEIVEKTEDPKEDLEKQVSDLKDKLLREMAETENLRRRSVKEKEETAKYAVSSFAKELLSVADNFDRALDASNKTSDDPIVKNLIIGLEATQRQLMSIFEKFAIKKLETNGTQFDPNLHQVMMEVENPNVPSGVIVQTLQSGYTMGDRLLREALVYVSKGSKNAIEHIDEMC